MDRFFHCTFMDTGSTKQMEDICRQLSCYHSRRNNIRFMDTHAISIQSCWSHFKRDWTYKTVNIHTVVDETTMAFTGAIQLAYNRDQHTHRLPENEKCAHCMSTNSRRHHKKILQVEETQQSSCILQEIHQQLQKFQGQQAIIYPLNTKSWTGSDLLCEEDTTKSLCTRNKEFNGKIRCCSEQFYQDTAFSHR